MDLPDTSRLSGPQSGSAEAIPAWPNESHANHRDMANTEIAPEGRPQAQGAVEIQVLPIVPSAARFGISQNGILHVVVQDQRNRHRNDKHSRPNARARADLEYDYSFITRGEARRLGLRIRPLPKARKKQYMTPVGRMIPCGYAEVKIKSLFHDLPWTASYILVLGFDGDRTLLSLGSKFFAEAKKLATPVIAHEITQTPAPDVSESPSPLPRLHTELPYRMPYGSFGFSQDTQAALDPSLLAPPIPTYPSTAGVYTPASQASIGDFSNPFVSPSSMTSQSTYERPIMVSGMSDLTSNEFLPAYNLPTHESMPPQLLQHGPVASNCGDWGSNTGFGQPAYLQSSNINFNQLPTWLRQATFLQTYPGHETSSLPLSYHVQDDDQRRQDSNQ